MPWLVVCAGLLVLAGLLLTVGALLPADYVVRARGRYARGPLEVFGAVRDVMGSAEWRSDVDRVEILRHEGELLRWREVGRAGSVTYEREAMEAPRRLVYRSEQARPRLAGRRTYEIRAEGRRTVLEITERGRVSGPWRRLWGHYVTGHHAFVERYIGELGAHFGEQTVPERLNG